MKNLLRKTTAALSAAVLTTCGCIGNFAAFAEESEDIAPKDVRVVFDFVLDRDTLGMGYKKDGKPSSLDDFGDIESTAGSVVTIPVGSFTSKEYTFSGWTIDGFYGYYSGDSFIIPEDYAEDELTVKAVWYNGEKGSVTASYNLERNGEEVERPDWLKDTKLTPGMIFSPNYGKIEGEDFTSYGLIYEGVELPVFTKIIVPENDFELFPIWINKIRLTLDPGDVDRIIGNDILWYDLNGGSSYDLPGPDRFSRMGFNLAGWTSSLDGKTYDHYATITLPKDEGITFTAVWEPKEYNVVFITGNGGKSVIIPGLTDTTVVCPEPNHTVSGKKFAGWKDENGDIYPVGSEYTIKGALPGLGISLKGVWIADDEPKLEVTLLGDANCDGKLTIADSTAILQHLGNEDKYKLSPQGQVNADCYAPGTGVTGLDAIAIQKIDANILTSLPELPE